MKFTKFIRRVLSICILFSSAASYAYEISGEVEAGGQSLRGDTASSKLEEYTDIPKNFFFRKVNVSLSGEAWYLRLNGSKPFLKDRSMGVDFGQWGKHKVSLLLYDQIPHNFSNTAQSLLRDDGNGIYSLPDSMQTTLQASATNAINILPWSPFVPLRVDRKTGGFSYLYNPAGRWRVNFGYSGEKRDGHKAIGVTYGHGQIQEALEPVDYWTHNASFGMEFQGEKMGVRAGYEISSFENNIKSLTVDNPFQLLESVLSAAGASTPGQARLALPPDNQSHQFNLDYSVKLPAKSRLETSFSMVLQTQNDPFLPLTVNGRILGSGRVPALPAESLNGERRTWNGSARWFWKPLDSVSVNLRGKQHTIDNRSPSLDFEKYVPFDSSISTATPTATFNPTRRRRSLPIDYARTNIGADVYYSVIKPVSLKLFYDWERFNRRLRDVVDTSEQIFGVSANLKSWKGFTLRPAYQYSRKTSANYDAEHVAHETFPLGEGVNALGQLPELRKYDMAGRRRQKYSVMADLSPVDALSLSADWGLSKDVYSADYGLLNSRTHYYSAELNVSPSADRTFYVGYSREEMLSATRSRYRVSGSATAPPLDTAANDWLGSLEDTVDTVNAGVRNVLIEGKMDMDLGWDFSRADGLQLSWNPNSLFGTAAQKNSAKATDLPATHTELHRFKTSLGYRWTKNLRTTLGYTLERYTETDWSQDSLDVYQPIWNKSVFLGATQGPYFAHMLSLSLSYKF